LSGPLAIAIDGPVASGKTAVGRLVAERLGARFLDTGSMYREVTAAALDGGIDLADQDALTRLAVELADRTGLTNDGLGGRLRAPEVDRGVSLVSMVPGVRSALVQRQRDIAGEGAIVMVGRDIGTVVLPEASVKVFLTASVQVRAERRFREPGANGPLVQVLRDLERRDRLDSERADSPLRPDEDAVIIDTDGLTIPETADRVMGLVNAGRAGARRGG
jgi:cytidylate kinase